MYLCIIVCICAQENILVCGQNVNRLKLATAKLQNDPSKCALQLVAVLFTAEELVNSNPPGFTNSKDEAQKEVRS